MSHRLFFDRAQRVLVVRFGAAMTGPSLNAMRADVKRFVAAHGHCRTILDFTAVETADVPGHFVADLARSSPIVVGEMRVLVAPKPEIFGLSRMYELHQISTAGNTLVVRTIADAHEALGLRALDLAPVESEPGA